jgi:DNA-binding HxlR family transcriptional regulator
MAPQEGTRRSQRHTAVTIAQPQPVADEKKLKEIFTRAKSGLKTVCPVRDIIVRFSDKWSMLTVLLLGGSGKMRFNEIKSSIGDVSQRMLTVTLRHLEQDGFVTRKVFAEVPPRVEYELTELGFMLMQQMSLLTEWIDAHKEQIVKARKMGKQA